jgi:AcrR family transcriptional regulator
MSGPVNPPRRYDASGRRELARATRRAVLAAATTLFHERGYAATTMADVAGAAGVAVQTVYSTVGGKAALLKEAYDVAIAGDDEPVPVSDRPQILAVKAETDGARKLELYAKHLAGVMRRTARLDQVLQVGADADEAVARLRDTLYAARYAGMTEFATNLRAQGLLRRGVTVTRAADVLVAHMDPVTYVHLVVERGWSRRDYQRWYVTVTAAALFPSA